MAISGVYRIDYAPSKAAVCQTTQCLKTKCKIRKGTMRVGVLVEIPKFGAPGGNITSMKWRHAWCMTAQTISNMKSTFSEDIEDFDGFDELNDDDRRAFKTIFDRGEVLEGEVPQWLKDDRAEAEATMIGTQAEKCETDQGSGSGSPTKVEGKTTPRAKGKGRISVKDEGAVALPPSKKTQKCPPKRKTHSSEEETEISGAPDPSDNDVKPAATGRRRKKQRAVSGHGQASKENGRATAKQKVKVEESEPSTDVASDEESREEDNDAATSEEEVMPKKNRAKEGSARGSSGRGPLRGFGRGRSRGKTIKVRKEWPGG